MAKGLSSLQTPSNARKWPFSRPSNALQASPKMPSNALQTPSNTLATHSPTPPLVSEAGHGRLDARPARTQVAKIEREHFSKSRDVARSRTMLARTMPFADWAKDEQPPVERGRLWLKVVCETMKIAALTPDEERLVKPILQLNKATAAMEANHVGA
jgi:hypothetical protein